MFEVKPDYMDFELSDQSDVYCPLIKDMCKNNCEFLVESHNGDVKCVIGEFFKNNRTLDDTISHMT